MISTHLKNLTINISTWPHLDPACQSSKRSFLSTKTPHEHWGLCSNFQVQPTPPHPPTPSPPTLPTKPPLQERQHFLHHFFFFPFPISFYSPSTSSVIILFYLYKRKKELQSYSEFFLALQQKHTQENRVMLANDRFYLWTVCNKHPQTIIKYKYNI